MPNIHESAGYLRGVGQEEVGRHTPILYGISKDRQLVEPPFVVDRTSPSQDRRRVGWPPLGSERRTDDVPDDLNGVGPAVPACISLSEHRLAHQLLARSRRLPLPDEQERSPPQFRSYCVFARQVPPQSSRGGEPQPHGVPLRGGTVTVRELLRRSQAQHHFRVLKRLPKEPPQESTGKQSGASSPLFLRQQFLSRVQQQVGAVCPNPVFVSLEHWATGRWG